MNRVIQLSWWVKSLSLFFILVPIWLTAARDWSVTFDDAYITYRYAKNLATGHGIRWNPNEAPTEGYTNFLLVIILAPIIKLGFDPLLVTRLLSYLSVFGTCLLLYKSCRRLFPKDELTPWISVLLILMLPTTTNLVLLGLETNLYVFSLFLNFIIGLQNIKKNSEKNSFLFATTSFLTFLLRPEGVLLFPVIWGTNLFHNFNRKKMNAYLIVLSPVLLALFLSGYFIWKHLYFGAWLPNPFFVKAATSRWISPLGVASIQRFLGSRFHQLILCLAIFSVCRSWLPRKIQTDFLKNATPTMCFFVAIMYALFFVRVDTLMDTFGRFLYPVVPFLVLASSFFFHDWLIKLQMELPRVKVGAVAVLVLVCSVWNLTGINPFKRSLEFAREAGISSEPSALMRKEFSVGQKLASYREIKKVRIAFADSGVIPYLTSAIWLDTVGLNDPFIARNQKFERVLNYMFHWKPDVLILPSLGSSGWLTYGHGPIGNVEQWARDPRMDEYEYVATSVTNQYDLQFFFLRTSVFGENLKKHIKSTVADGFFLEFPMDVGTRKGNKGKKWQLNNLS